LRLELLDPPTGDDVEDALRWRLVYDKLKRWVEYIERE
jgi:hypothetical protein